MPSEASSGLHLYSKKFFPEGDFIDCLLEDGSRDGTRRRKPEQADASFLGKGGLPGKAVPRPGEKGTARADEFLQETFCRGPTVGADAPYGREAFQERGYGIWESAGYILVQASRPFAGGEQIPYGYAAALKELHLPFVARRLGESEAG